VDEFAYHGDATVTRPDYASATAMTDFTRYVFERVNPLGLHRELWYHAAGCHAWLVVTRGIATHTITAVEMARDVAAKRVESAKELAS
jgi:sarcosine oxidase subunit delta